MGPRSRGRRGKGKGEEGDNIFARPAPSGDEGALE